MNSRKYELALALARYAHEGQTDKAGADYIQHPMAVAEQLTDEDCRIAALLHDTLEDTFVTPATLENLFGRRIREAVEALTHREGEDYMTFVARAAGNAVALQVKMADIRHNMDLRRLPEVTRKDLLRQEKYKAALHYLEKVWDESRRSDR